MVAVVVVDCLLLKRTARSANGPRRTRRIIATGGAREPSGRCRLVGLLDGRGIRADRTLGGKPAYCKRPLVPVRTVGSSTTRARLWLIPQGGLGLRHRIDELLAAVNQRLGGVERSQDRSRTTPCAMRTIADEHAFDGWDDDCIGDTRLHHHDELRV